VVGVAALLLLVVELFWLAWVVEFWLFWLLLLFAALLDLVLLCAPWLFVGVVGVVFGVLLLLGCCIGAVWLGSSLSETLLVRWFCWCCW